MTNTPTSCIGENAEQGIPVVIIRDSLINRDNLKDSPVIECLDNYIESEEVSEKHAPIMFIYLNSFNNMSCLATVYHAPGNKYRCFGEGMACKKNLEDAMELHKAALGRSDFNPSSGKGLIVITESARKEVPQDVIHPYFSPI